MDYEKENERLRLLLQNCWDWVNSKEGGSFLPMYEALKREFEPEEATQSDNQS